MSLNLRLGGKCRKDCKDECHIMEVQLAEPFVGLYAESGEKRNGHQEEVQK